MFESLDHQSLVVPGNAGGAVSPSVPDGAQYADISVAAGSAVRYRHDGGDPGGTVGALIRHGENPYRFDGDLPKLRLLSATPEDTVVEITYLR